MTTASAFPAAPILFYDGGCGLCHRAVTFALRWDREGIFRFAPLQGETLQDLVNAETRASLPDSLVLRLEDGTLKTRSDAVVGLLSALPAPWPAVGFSLWIIPTFLRNLGYDGIAKVRHRFFKKPDAICPWVPLTLKARFLP